MRVFHPETVHGARDAWGRRHAGLIVGWRFYLAGIVIAAAVVGWRWLTSPARHPANPHPVPAAASGGDWSIPAAAILLVVVVVVAIPIGYAVANRRGGRRHLDVDMATLLAEHPERDDDARADDDRDDAA